ncbi:UNVERIFIED_CONTAM: hypothetical protein HDU68_004385, partial [Siphonaria sp. JEL0065]
MADFSKLYVKDTREWLLKYIWEWVFNHDDAPIMWLCSGSGMGKTFISYTCITNVPFKSDALILGSYFFCGPYVQAIDMVKTIVCNLVQSVGLFSPEFTTHVQGHLSNGFLLDPFEAFLLFAVEGLKRVSPSKTILLVIDGLDECDMSTRATVLKILNDLSPQLPSFVKLFVTSRPETEIYLCLTKLDAFEFTPLLDENLQDIDIFLQQRFQQLGYISTEAPETSLACKKLLMEKSGGIFIYCHVVCKHLEDVDLRNALAEIQRLPLGIDGLYSFFAKKAFKSLGKYLYQTAFQKILVSSYPLDIVDLSESAIGRMHIVSV